MAQIGGAVSFFGRYAQKALVFEVSSIAKQALSVAFGLICVVCTRLD